MYTTLVREWGCATVGVTSCTVACNCLHLGSLVGFGVEHGVG